MVNKILLAIVSICLLFVSCNEKKDELEVSSSMDIVDSSSLHYGFSPDSFYIVEGEIQQNEFLADILLKAKVPYHKIHQLAEKSKEVFDVRNIRSGGYYSLLCEDSCTAADYMIYQNSPYQYVLFDISNGGTKVVKKKTDKILRVARGSIYGSLWLTMDSLGLPYELISLMEKSLASSVDFYHIQAEDSFQVLYEEEIIDGEYVGIGKVLAAYFKNYDNEYYSIWFDTGKDEGYFDECGRPSKGAFLKSPIEFARISSRYNKRRLHPVLKYVKPHLGTDYAAACGTPIRSTANGVIIAASYTRGNGRYIKVKHNDTYTTQYLHMTRFAKGIRKGVHVKQGQTIGYVGKTGLATGCHVCYRFWKNGKQVDHLRQNLPAPSTMPKESLPEFFEHRDSILQMLDIYLEPEIQLSYHAQSSDRTPNTSIQSLSK